MSARLRVRVAPRSSSDAIVGWSGDELAVRVSAPPAEGRANEAVCALVAGRLGVPKSAVKVVRGARSRHKTLEIEGASSGDVAASLGAPADSTR